MTPETELNTSIADLLCLNRMVSLRLMILVAVLLVLVLVRHNPSSMFLLVVEDASSVIVTLSRVLVTVSKVVSHNPSSLFPLAIVTKVELKLPCRVRIVAIMFFSL